MKYKLLSEQVLKNVGGVENISHIEHCATRLRIHYKNKDKINEDAIKEIEGVVGTINKGDQIQVIIGPDVHVAYNDFLEVSKFNEVIVKEEVKSTEEKSEKKIMHYVNAVGNFSAAVFMPIVPALITGGLILVIRNLLINYFGVSMESGTAEVLTGIFTAAFMYIPVYLGYTTAKRLKMEPIMGALLGAFIVSPAISGVEGLDFLGIAIPTVDYGSSILPVIMGVFLMYYVDKLFTKILPEAIRYFLKPLLTMIVVAPITIIVLGPIGTQLSGAVANGIVWLMDTAGFIAMPILSALYPYMVMLGIDKAITPIGFQSVATLGYDPITVVMGFISNLSVGATALAVAFAMKKDKGKRGVTASAAITGICGVTEPAFYGALVMRPKVLIGTAAGAVSAGLIAGIFGLKSYVMGFCPGILTILFFLNPDGTMTNLIVALVVGIVAVVVAFTVTTIIIKKDKTLVVEQ
ncbi:PTS transporter subunit EIIC [Erysipelothrix sp. HDW6C]|uniref:PTS transporter subunit EIIC n=1 Tax=Erysipelothrix sp. HDW6C TaxID=2714930 RepID=UPI001408DEAD|nr:PTS transporter subunit EIIC [Erysipelothrix sp. HDW6C]QIK70277.1 PTS transporter subunit EIIC [Erysipelothrix sp. HDW6C]